MSSSPSQPTASTDRLKLFVLPLIILTLLVIAVFDQSPRAPDAGFWKPGGIYGDNWDSVKYEPFSGGRWGVPFSLLLIGHFFVTHLIGYQMVRPWLAMSRVPFGVKLCASFLPGYLALAGINRILNLVFPNSIAPALCVAVSILLCWLVCRSRYSEDTSFSATIISHWKHLAILSGVYILSILLHIHLGRIFMVSDSTSNTFLPILTQLIQKLNEIRFFPLVDQQYDEFAFSYPLNFLPPGRSLLIVPYWWLAAIGKAALCATFWVILFPIQDTRRLSLIALVGAPFLVFSGLVANPLKYIDLTACMLPILDGWHIGRFLGPTLPFLVLGMFFEKTSEKPSRLTAALLGIGVGTTSIHNTLFTIGTVTLAVLWFYVKPFRVSPKIWRPIAIIASTTNLLAILFTYASSTATPPFYNGWPLVLGALLSSACLLVRPTHIPTPDNEEVPRPNFNWIIFIAGLFLSVGLLGNMPSKKIIGAIRPLVSEHILPGGYQLTIQRAANLANIDAPKQYFRFVGNRSPSKHALSFSNFLGYYGLLIICAFSLLGIWAHPQFQNSTNPQLSYHLQLVLFFTATLAMAFFSVDFILDGVLPWIKYRLIEIPFIGILILLIKKANDTYTKNLHLAIAITLSSWTILAFFTHEPIEQLLSNIKYLIAFF
ncbi:MAG: hypothetical protein WCO60_06900 [Verrucomicrobiota bacterium]